ncbi:MAG: hypothetical protein AAF632_04185 [Bacteroidota bacterium]
MKISRELLKKYAQGACTDEERAAVEAWLASEDTFEDTSYDAIFIPQKDSIRENLLARLGGKWPSSTSESERARVVPLYQRLSRYAAAACVVIGTFFLGYFASPPSAQADTVKKPKHLTDLLYIYGGNGAYTKMNATRYRVKFEGRLKLYNDADQPKQLVCGEQEFTLEPHRAYFLSGSNQNALLTKDQGQPYSLEGDFSILELDD